MTLGSGSAWYLTGDSTATTLSNKGLLDMTADGNTFSTLTLDTLSGDGGLILMDIGTGGSDRIETENFTGTQTIYLLSTSGSDVAENAIGTVLLVAESGDGTLTVNDHEGTLFWQKEI